MKLGTGLSRCPNCWANTEPSTGRTKGGRGAEPRLSKLMPCKCSFWSVFMQRTTASLSAMVAQRDIKLLKWTPGSFVGIERNGPALIRPGLGSHVSNWLGAPQSHKRMHRLAVRLACWAKAGSEKSPAQLPSDTVPAAPRPVRNFRRCRT